MKQMKVRFLGSFQVTTDDPPHTLTLKTEKSRALFAYLLMENDRPHRRAKLVDLFWSSFPDISAHNSLRQSIYNIRSLSAEFQSTPFHLLTSGSDTQLIPQTGLWVDAFELTSQLSQCEEHHKPGTMLCDSCLNRLLSIVDLYGGDFMDGFLLRDAPQFDWWLLNKREVYHRRVLQALMWITNSFTQKEDYLQAIEFARREVELDPWCEPAHQRYMKVLALAGERGKALRQYEIFQNILTTEVGIEPSLETRSLCEQIRKDSLKSLSQLDV